MAGRARIKGKALSVRQPWAWTLIEGLKDVENRTFRTNYRGALIIHAALRDDLNGWHFLDEMEFPLPVDPPTGGIIGVVDLADCVQGYDSVWAQEGVLALAARESSTAPPFVAYKGRLGLFNVL